jgi:hypothetical protein
MSRNNAKIAFIALLLMCLQREISVSRADGTLEHCLVAVADRLEKGQLDDGTWPGEEAYTGSLVTALARAYALTGNEAYASAAADGGNFILTSAAGNYYGDEAYALVCLSRMAGDPAQTPWWAAADDFYSNVKHLAAGSTAGYVSEFLEAELSASVCLVSHHTVAAFAVDAEDKAIWREGLVRFLVLIDDDFAVFPVMALGAATWALATTGDLEDTLLDPWDEGAAYWQGRTFADLPSLLLGHQVPDGNDAGSFYWRFDHEVGQLGEPVGGYTEDTAFGTLGLVAASKVQDSPRIRAGIGLAREALLAGCDEEGVVRRHLWLGGEPQYVYGASSLRALAGSVSRADLNLDGCVDNQDLAVLGGCWREEEPLERQAHGRVDMDDSGVVDLVDLRMFGEEWLGL